MCLGRIVRRLGRIGGFEVASFDLQGIFVALEGLLVAEYFVKSLVSTG
jgi:hypothetical protein